MKTFKYDLQASIVVFLIALPLGMGMAIASGYPPIAGLISSIVGGIVVGAFSGAPLQVSGAAAGLTVIVYQGVQQFGLEQMGLVVLLAGLLQVAAGAGGIGRWFQAVSPTVLYGMLAGIGVLIIASQIYVMLDLAPKGGGLANLTGIPTALALIWQPDTSSAVMSFGLGMLTIAILVLWPKFAKGKLEYLPAPLLAILAATIVAALGSLPVQYVSIPDNLFTEWKPTQFNLGVILGSPALLGLAIQLGMIASAESLLCAAAVDQMHDGPRANMDRELTAQGLGNMVCGFLGTLPLTGVIVRSSANVHAGGKTRGSTILHGIWLLLFIVMLPGILELIPTSALAGLLVYTGGKLVNLKTAKLIYRLGRSELVIYLTTVGVIFFVDLLTGILVGLMMASLKLLKSLSHLSVKVESHSENRKVILIMGGAATFLRLPKLAAALANVPSGSEVVIEAQDLYRIDYACQEHFKAWRRRYERHGGKVEVGELF